MGPPLALGACNASQRGMGGVWFMRDAPPIVWRAAFPLAIQRELITSSHHQGTLSISDLELSGTIAHKHILATAVHSVAERPVWLADDNRASLSWAAKGSSTSTAARSYLLRLNALHQRRFGYVPHHDFNAGNANGMADDTSRLWMLSDTDLLTHFNLRYPQDTSWTLHHLSTEMLSTVTGSLLRRRYMPTTLRIGTPPLPVPGASGNVYALPSASAPTCLTCQATLSPSSCCSRSVTERASSPPARNPCDLAQWRTRSDTWRRRSPAWGPQTLA